MQMGNFMKYADVTLNGEKYRAVKFTEYRPYWSYYLANTAYSYLDENGYYKNTIYWFKYPPVILVVLLVLCLVISVGLERLKSVTKYYKLCDLTVNLTKKEK